MRGGGSRVLILVSRSAPDISTPLSFSDDCVYFFFYIYIYTLVLHQSKEETDSFSLIRAPHVNEPLLFCPQEINKSVNHSEIGKVSAC